MRRLVRNQKACGGPLAGATSIGTCDCLDFTDCCPVGASKLRLRRSCTTAGRLDRRVGMLGLIPGRTTAFATCCPLPQAPRIVQPPLGLGLLGPSSAAGSSAFHLANSRAAAFFSFAVLWSYVRCACSRECCRAAPKLSIIESSQSLEMGGKSRDSELISRGKRSKHLN